MPHASMNRRAFLGAMAAAAAAPAVAQTAPAAAERRAAGPFTTFAEWKVNPHSGCASSRRI